MEKQTIFISFSGGRTSAFMLYWMLYISKKYKDYQIVILFANTGKEREETLDFVNECAKRWNLDIVWLEAEFHQDYGRKNWFRIVDFETANRDGQPFEALIKKERIPNKENPICSERLKTRPMHKYMRHGLGIKKYTTSIGLRSDEQHRINWESAKKENKIYPLVTDFRVDSKYIRKWWDNQDFDIGVYIPKQLIQLYFARQNTGKYLKFRLPHWNNDYTYSVKQCFDPNKFDTETHKFVSLRDYEGNCDSCYKKSTRKHLTIIVENPKIWDWPVQMEEKHGTDEGYVFFRENNSAIDLIEMAKNGGFIMQIDELEVEKMSTPNLFGLDLDAEASCFCGTD